MPRCAAQCHAMLRPERCPAAADPAVLPAALQLGESFAGPKGEETEYLKAKQLLTSLG